VFDTADSGPWAAPQTRDVSGLPKEDASLGQPVLIKKSNDDEQIVYGEVYVPGFPDSQGDFMTEASVKEMAYGFMQKGITTHVDVNHSQEVSGCFIVESFVARKGDPDFIPGSWVVGVHIPSAEIWGMVKSGELNGFSLDGFGRRVPSIMEIDIPEFIKGETDLVDGHSHSFTVHYDANGNFVGGMTNPGPDGHVHRILRGTITEESRGHTHQFSFVEGVLDAQIAA
jgi:hypothetical protein